ncbi:hypothetical protein Acsp04_14800 [Actinomadura sp. NBRC 104425]|uniref:hypothetical protein n=1 Tax=Actinomadura sp. NBRC 104425 TaxID=3032204 RepID=UPI0024A5D0B1|nr:hypothetical protein [Actinomadura sp. NBRC 104425]GLZ11245.1 hypothetical protein Acsp04_14800 [Actinomadura sp. NBRC 104425]
MSGAAPPPLTRDEVDGALRRLRDDELTAMCERARALLWTSPCDLRGATVALSVYQQAFSARAKGSRR